MPRACTDEIGGWGGYVCTIDADGPLDQLLAVVKQLLGGEQATSVDIASMYCTYTALRKV